MRPLDVLLISFDVVHPLLRAPVLEREWESPSSLPEFSNNGLAGHLARSAFNLERALDTQPVGGVEVADAVAYYSTSDPEPPDSRTGRRIRELGELESEAGPESLAARFARSVVQLQDRQIEPNEQTVLFGRSLPVDECATCCLLELVVHADDLAFGLGVSTPEFSVAALDLVAVTLAKISGRRNGGLALVRALARSERAPSGGISAF